MDDSFRQATVTISSRKEASVYSAYVKPTGFLKSNLILFITNSNIHIFKSNGSKIKQSFSISSLMGIKIDNNVISLLFPKQTFSFESTEKTEILHHLYDVIQHVLTLQEQRKLLIDNFRVVQQKHNGLGALFRLQTISKNPILNNFKKVESILVYSQPYVSFGIFEDPINFIPDFIQIIPLCPHIKSLSCTKIENLNTYLNLKKLARNEFRLKHIAIQGETTPEFVDFITALKENRDSKLFGIGFTESDINKEHLVSLESLVLTGDLRSLEFHRAIQKEAMTYFYNSFLTPKLFDSLYILNLAGTTSIDISRLLPKITKVKMLSLANCGIDINDVFAEIASLTNLKSIDLSNNRCSDRIINAEYKLPPTLNTLYVNDISFSSATVVPFMAFIFNNFKTGLRLSIASIITPTDEWDEIFSFLHHCSFRSLVSLIWDSNRVHPKFFTFLLQSPYFDSLSLNYCINYSTAPDTIVSLTLYIQSTESLSRLSVRGNQKCFIGNNIGSLLKTVQASTTLQFLDLTFSNCGDDGLNQLSTFLSKWSPLKELVIDGAKPKSADSLIQLLSTASKLRDHLKLSFPQNDIDHLIKKNKLSSEAALKIKKLFFIDENSKSFFLSAFRIYRYYLFDQFPNYLRKVEIDELNSSQPLISEILPVRNVPENNPYPASELQSPTVRSVPAPFGKGSQSPKHLSPVRKTSPRKILTKKQQKLLEKQQSNKAAEKVAAAPIIRGTKVPISPRPLNTTFNLFEDTKNKKRNTEEKDDNTRRIEHNHKEHVKSSPKRENNRISSRQKAERSPNISPKSSHNRLTDEKDINNKTNHNNKYYKDNASNNHKDDNKYKDIRDNSKSKNKDKDGIILGIGEDNEEQIKNNEQTDKRKMRIRPPPPLIIEDDPANIIRHSSNDDRVNANEIEERKINLKKRSSTSSSAKKPKIIQKKREKDIDEELEANPNSMPTPRRRQKSRQSTGKRRNENDIESENYDELNKHSSENNEKMNRNGNGRSSKTPTRKKNQNQEDINASPKARAQKRLKEPKRPSSMEIEKAVANDASPLPVTKKVKRNARKGEVDDSVQLLANVKEPFVYAHPVWVFPEFKERYDVNTFWKNLRSNYVVNELVSL